MMSFYYQRKDIEQVKVFNTTSHRWFICVEYVTKKDVTLCQHFAIMYSWYQSFLLELGGFVARNDGEIYFKTKELAEYAKEEFCHVLHKLQNDSQVRAMKEDNKKEITKKFDIVILPTTNKNHINKFVLTCMEFEVQDYYWADIIGLKVEQFKEIMIENYNAVKTAQDIYWNSIEDAEKAKQWLESQIIVGRLSNRKQCRWF